MKILSLNTHSLQEENYEEKLDIFLKFILQEQPDLIALQEVNQSTNATEVGNAECIGMVSLPEIRISLKIDNHALRVVRALRYAGIHCSWAWLPIKRGYDKYDEGVAILSLKEPITHTDVCTISRADDYMNWRTRKVLGVRVGNRREWFYTVHMGWWQDAQEPFIDQWDILSRHLEPIAFMNRVWLMGDFNSPAEVRGQGYDLISGDGWKDTFILAEKKDSGCTVSGVIDGWRELLDNPESMPGMRIDHIWCSKEAPVLKSRVVFNGKHEPVVSDHFGILMETKGEN